MQYIDAKFKDNDPISTVEKIQGILRELDIEVTEKWNDSGVENCYSLIIFGKNGVPSANGKGVTKELARASAYGEFIERLQNGLFYYKYQSINRQPGMNIHTYAPDVKYMTVDELIRDGEWMDHLVDAYGPGVTRETIAEHCKAFACTDNDEIATVPFYSLFEDKYVWIPIGFDQQIYTTNGCCAGNTKEEAWVHALSEIMERYCTLRILSSGKSAPQFPEEFLNRYPTVSSILTEIRKNNEYDVALFDFSIGNGFPVISTRIISKKDHSYRVNVAADPVLEIALQRTLTEMFQGVNLQNVAKKHEGRILASVDEFPIVSNVTNQLENGTGFFTADFFANELTCTTEISQFDDNSNLNNKQLLRYMLDIFRNMGKQVYVRNLSFLGFPSYRILIPGFSEARAMRLSDLVPEYAIAEQVGCTLRNAAAATDDDLNWMLQYSQIIRGIRGRYNNFNRIAGIPLAVELKGTLASITRAYASYRLKRYKDAIRYASAGIGLRQEDQDYFKCVNRYLELKISGIQEEKIKVILYKFFETELVDKLYNKLENGQTPYDDYLIACDFTSCDRCRYGDRCSFRDLQKMNIRIGARYQEFTEGQDRSLFMDN